MIVRLSVTLKLDEKAVYNWTKNRGTGIESKDIREDVKDCFWNLMVGVAEANGIEIVRNIQ